ncbi:MAG: MATE family efflux transporter [Rubrimonas sp.]|uniref:MATE family efflux transporter n=1 Tax=Rubrimonas sp. TaxID=2036015 RepID=UPI002FDD1FE2
MQRIVGGPLDLNAPGEPGGARARQRAAWVAEVGATLSLAWPLIVAQLATIGLNTTDVVMMGWLGPEFLASGSLAVSMLYPLLMLGTGVAMAAAPMAAQALGARRRRSARRTVRQGLWLSAILAFLLAIPLLMAGPILVALGQSPRIADLAQEYLRYGALMLPSALMFTVLRGYLSAHGRTQVVLWITLAGIGLNAFLDYALMFGHFGFPRLELAGAGIATAVVYAAMFGLLLVHVLRVRRRDALLARFWRADWPRFFAMLRLGLPIGLTMMAESGLFACAALLMGLLGPDALAGHAIALQLAAIAFMAPLGLSHATTVRVGRAFGAGDAAGAKRAGYVSIGLAVVFMSMTALLFWLAPQTLVGLFLRPGDAAAADAAALAASFLAIAALFQIVDGVQVTASAGLRGLSDTAAPMVIALCGYWLVGLPTAWLIGFPLGMDGVGVWLGLAAGLAFAALVLATRFVLSDAKPDPRRARG